MTNETIKHILIEKGITHLYHANTIATASTFLENGGLLSRGYVEDHSLFQTYQKTAESDKKVDVFYDIFFDSVDIHQRISNLNYYGPVVFVYSVNLIDMLPEGYIKITRDNPIRWNSNMAEAEKYFLSEFELKSSLAKGNFAQHITIRHQQEPLSFDYLENIIIDDPGIDDTSRFKSAYEHLRNLAKQYDPTIPLEIRSCNPNCNCKTQYRLFPYKYV